MLGVHNMSLHGVSAPSEQQHKNSDQKSPMTDQTPGSDKENSEDEIRNEQTPQVHKEIMEKLKHESAILPEFHERQRMFVEAAFQAAAQKAKMMNDSPPKWNDQMNGLATPNDMLRREALLSLQHGPKFDYLSQLAMLHEQQTMMHQQSSTPATNSQTPPRNPTPSSDEDENVQVELSSPAVQSNSSNCQWTYEEQFKQLYELDSDPERKKFLDDLFGFMQKRASPVNRIPIMAKQTLDMYKLFKLVVEKGGLVEVINKKLWREITKGLNLPSSITSAAFTLRTQYMKYIYPYECEKYGFSNPNELQTAIDGNRRESRRPGFGYDMPSPNIGSLYNQPFPTGNPFFPNGLMANPMASLFQPQMNQMNTSMMSGNPLQNRLQAPICSNGNQPDDRSHSPINVSSPQPQQSAFPSNQSSTRNEKEPEVKRRCLSHPNSPKPHCPPVTQHQQLTECRARTHSLESSQSVHTQQSPSSSHLTHPSTLITMKNNRQEISEKKGDDSVRVSMEINGITYQGVLFPKVCE